MQVLVAAVAYDNLRANRGNALWLLLQLRDGVGGAWIGRTTPPAAMTRRSSGDTGGRVGGDPALIGVHVCVCECMRAFVIAII